MKALVERVKAGHGWGCKLSRSDVMNSGKNQDGQKDFFHGLELDINFGIEADFENNRVIGIKFNNPSSVLGSLHG